MPLSKGTMAMEKHTVLLVDDDPSTLHMIERALANQGYLITAASHGQAAIDLITTKHFDLVLTDMIMAPIDGVEVLKRAKEISPDTMVIILTGHADVHFAVEALRLAADDYLIKPVDLDMLYFRVSSCLEKFRLKKQISESQNNLILFKNLVAFSNQAIAVSGPDGQLIYVNPAHEKLFGRSLEMARSLNYRDYYPERSIEKYNQEILPALKKGESWEGFIDALDSEKHRFLLWQRAYAMYDEEGEIHCCFTLMHKFKERKVEEKFRQAQHAQAIGTLAGGIAHEFNNILWIIVANIELASGNLPEGNRAHKNLQRMEKACARATDLVQQILSFSRQGEYRPRPLDIMPIVKESLKFLRSSIPTTIEIRTNIMTQSATIMADPSQMHQTIINLCTNAADAIGKKPGVLEISMTDVELGRDETVFHHDLVPGKYVKLSVKDTGIGMKSEVRKRIFEPFFTTKGVGEGKGMGLAVIHGTVESCEGTIEVHSEPGKGSTFHLFFPKIEKRNKPGPAGFIPSVKGKERILFVDDDKDIANMGKEILEACGYRVVSKTCSMEALKTFRERPDEFDLIITDMVMPKMTGEELAEKSVQIRPDIPIILCTGYNEEIYNEKAREIGIKKVIMKPINGRDLANAIKMLLKENMESQDITGEDES